MPSRPASYWHGEPDPRDEPLFEGLGPRPAGDERKNLARERTCVMEHPAYDWYRCTSCGAFVNVHALTDATAEIPVRYCPNCGARRIFDGPRVAYSTGGEDGKD